MSDQSIRQTEDQTMGETAHDVVERQTAGRQLAARRQQLGWSVEHVAARLNLAPRQVEAIEADNHAALPGVAVTRGFIRAYAKLLSIDAAPLITGLTPELSPLDSAVPLRRPLPSAPFVPTKLAPIRRGGKPWLAIVLAIVLIALIGGYVAHQAGLLGRISDEVALQLDTRRDSSDVAQPAADTGAVLTVALTPPESGTATATPAAAAQAGAETPQPTDSTPAASTPAAATAEQTVQPVQPEQASAPVGADAVITTTSSAAAPATSSSATTGKRKLLVLKAIEDCWVEIRRPDNTALLSKTIVAGSTEQIELDGPVSAVFGNAGGIEATLRGEPVDLRSRAKNNVARINLG